MLTLAWRNLAEKPARWLLSVGGIGLALLLTLSLDAIVAGFQGQITSYIDHSGADVWVSQQGVRNLHMAASALPESAIATARSVAGVDSVTPILYMTNMVASGSQRRLSYIVGLPPAPAAGAPWAGTGRLLPSTGQIVIDRLLAAQLGIKIGDRVSVLDRPLTVAGLSEGTAGIINYVSFLNASDFEAVRPSPGVVSYLLVRARPGTSADDLAARLAAALPAETVQTTAAFAASESKVVTDMSTQVINSMSLVGFLVGLAVVALTMFMATAARRSEYGVLKALGASHFDLVQTVALQALFSVAGGFALGVAGSLALAAVVPVVQPLMSLVVTPHSLLTNAVAALLIATIAALLPMAQIARLDPVTVFRRRYA